jgi:hypothetical protein
LLAPDIWKDAISGVLKTWGERAEKYNREKPFSVIKVPHHGSIKSHDLRLCQSRHKADSGCVATISAGTRDGLPNADVLRDYLNEGWKVMVTTSKKAASRRNALMDIANRGGQGQYTAVENTIVVSWSMSTGLSAEPKDAEVHTEDIKMYASEGEKRTLSAEL